jgi:iron-sulfur cluster assembly protein
MVHTTVAALLQAAASTARNAPSRKAVVEVTSAAANRIRQLLQARHKVCGGGHQHLLAPRLCRSVHLAVFHLQEYIKLGVKKRGCSGLSYTLNYAGESMLLSISWTSDMQLLQLL